jgi:hypothetical protein
MIIEVTHSDTQNTQPNPQRHDYLSFMAYYPDLAPLFVNKDGSDVEPGTRLEFTLFHSNGEPHHISAAVIREF